MKVYLQGYRIGIGFKNESYYQLAKKIKVILAIVDIGLTLLALFVATPAIVGVLLLILLGILITRFEKRSITETVGSEDEVSVSVNRFDSEEEVIKRNDDKYRDKDER